MEEASGSSGKPHGKRQHQDSVDAADGCQKGIRNAELWHGNNLTDKEKVQIVFQNGATSAKIIITGTNGKIPTVHPVALKKDIDGTVEANAIDGVEATRNVMMNSIFLGAEFSSYKQFTEALEEYSSLNYVQFCIRDCKNLQCHRVRKTARRIEFANKDLKYYNLHFCCVFGNRKPGSSKKATGQRQRQSNYKGCKAHIKLLLSQDAQSLQIVSCNLEHNHLISEEEFRHLPNQRRLTMEQKKWAYKLLQQLPNKKMVQDKLLKETGKIIKRKDLSNISARFKGSLISDEENLEDALQLNEDCQPVKSILCEDKIYQGSQDFAIQDSELDEITSDIAAHSESEYISENPIKWNNSQSDHALVQSPSLLQSDLDKSLMHIKSSSGESKELQINEAILYMIIKDSHPLSVVEDQGFLHLMNVVAPLYKVPSFKTLSKMLNNKYDTMVVSFKEKFSAVEHLSLTCYVWIDATGQNYIGITAHFCEDFKLKAVTLGLYALDQPNDHIYVALKLNEMCYREWGINHNKVVAVVSDNRTNIVNAIENCFGNQKHIYCFAQALTLIPSKSIALTPGLKKLLNNHIRSIFSFFEENVRAGDILRKAHDNEENVPRFEQEVSTHWHSTYCMLQHFLRLSNIINSILTKFSSAPPMLSPSNLCVARDIFKFLNIIKQITMELARENYVTCSKVIPLVKILVNKIETTKPASQIGTSYKQNILNEINVCFQDVEKIDTLAISTLIDPRFKKVHFQDPLAVACATNKMLKLLSDLNYSSTKFEIVPQNIHENDEEDLWSFHKMKVSRGTTKKTFGVLNELTTYFSQPVLHITSNPLKYWDAMQNVFPNISKLALKYFSITATSVPAERLFTKAGSIITEKRNMLSQKQLIKILLLNSNCT